MLLDIVHVGGGLFGRITGYPMRNASWHGCGESGGERDQLVKSRFINWLFLVEVNILFNVS